MKMRLKNHKQHITGSDHFIMAMDHRMRKEGSAGNICRIVARLDGVLTEKQLRDKLGGIEGFAAMSQIGFKRTLPLTAPYWKSHVRPKQITVAEHSVANIAEDIKIESLTPVSPVNIKRDAAIAFDLFAYTDEKTDVLMSWHHGIMDVRGSLALFSQLFDGCAEKIGFTEEPAADKQSFVEKIKQLPAGLQYARKSLIHIDQACKIPMTSFSSPKGGSPGKDNYALVRFDKDQTLQIEQCCEQIASGYKKSIFSLAAVTRAIDAALTTDTQGPERTYVVPCPQNQRKRGGATDILSNQVSFLFYRISSKSLTDIQTAISALSGQLMHQVREQFPHSFSKAMDVFRVFPVKLYSTILYGPSKGKLASFFFSDIGPLPELTAINGLSVIDLVVPAPAPTTPSLAVSSWSFNGMLNICFSYSKNIFTEKQISLIKEKLISELLEIEIGAEL
jgi:hypothetical protein